MEGTKSLVTSKTFWGGVVMVGAFIASLLGTPLSPEDTTATIDVLAKLALVVAEAIGFFVVLYGRIKASKTIRSVV